MTSAFVAKLNPAGTICCTSRTSEVRMRISLSASPWTKVEARMSPAALTRPIFRRQPALSNGRMVGLAAVPSSFISAGR